MFRKYFYVLYKQIYNLGYLFLVEHIDKLGGVFSMKLRQLFSLTVKLTLLKKLQKNMRN